MAKVSFVVKVSMWPNIKAEFFKKRYLVQSPRFELSFLVWLYIEVEAIVRAMSCHVFHGHNLNRNYAFLDI